MPLVTTPAIILSAQRYSESSKIIRIATRDHGVQSVIAKGALRPRSRFGAALQVLSEGQAQILLSERRDLHTLTAFDLGYLPASLTREVARYAGGMALAEVTLRFSATDPHPEAFDLLSEAIRQLESAAPDQHAAVAIRALWLLISVLGYAPVIAACVRDGRVIPPGELPFSAADGGAICPGCALGTDHPRLPPEARAALEALVDAGAPLPELDSRNAAAHRRLLGRYIQYQLADGSKLPALDFWLQNG